MVQLKFEQIKKYIEKENCFNSCMVQLKLLADEDDFYKVLQF